MPAHAKLATALAMSLAVVGGGTALAQSTNAVEGHSAYVTMVNVQSTADQDEEVTGTVTCDAPLHERVVRRTMGRQACLTDEYAYAYPSDQPAPWTAEIEDVTQDMYVDESGAMWHVAEVSYKTLDDDPDGGGPELVEAMASEILPADGGEELSYAMPVDEDLLEQTDEDITVDVGPSPSQAPQSAQATTLPDH